MLRRHFGKLLVALAVVSLALGISGFLTMDPAATVSTAVYRSVQLFYWNYFPWNTTAEAHLPWTMEIARWLAPLATLGAIFRVAVALFHRHWDSLRASRQRGHALICGAGERGLTLARDLMKRGLTVVIVERDSQRADDLAADGFLTVCGEASRDDVLLQCAACEARVVIATSDSDHDNLAIAMAAASAGAVSIVAHSGNSALSDLYQRHSALTSPQSNSAEVRIFNTFRNLARQTLAAFPPEPSNGAVYVILPELEDCALALAVEYALMGHFPGDKRVHLILAGPQSATDRELLVARFPGIVHCMDLSWLSVCSSEMFSSQVADFVRRTPGDFTIFPSLTDTNLAFGRALEILDRVRGRSGLRILLPAIAESPIPELVMRNPLLRPALGVLPTQGEACGYEAVIAESLDRTARSIHEHWLAETQRQIVEARASGNEALAQAHETKTTFRPWAQLNEEQKGASRSQADHIPFKLRAAELDPARASRRQWAALPTEQTEVLARVEHARWAAYCRMTGWVYGEERDDRAKQHPNLVDYDSLDEPTRDYDRVAVLNLAHYLPVQSA